MSQGNDVVRIRTVDWEGTGLRSHLEFPVRRGRGNTPVWSPDGSFVAFDAAHVIYVAPTRADQEHQKIEPDPAHPKYILTERGLGYRFMDYRNQEK